MKYLGGISIAVGVALSCFLQPTVFGAYGGGGSSMAQFKTTLSRDVCLNGDNSVSYYDGSCGSSSKASFVTQNYDTTRLGEHAVTNNGEEREIDAGIAEGKEQLKKEIAKDSEKALNMPIKYRKIQLQVEKIMSRWDVLSPETKHKRAVLLIKKINKLLETAKLTPKALATAQYIKDKATMMTTY